MGEPDGQQQGRAVEQIRDPDGRAGVDDLVLGVVPGNRATSLYERFGFRTTWTYLSRFAGRDHPNPAM